MSDFHFLRPEWFAALLPALLLLVLLWRQRSRGGDWRQLVAPALLSHLLLDARRSLRRTPLLLLGLGWLLSIVALAGPVWERHPQPVYRAPTDRVIVLDMSASMAATDLKPDRLAQARYVIRNLLDQQHDGRTALVVFSGEPHVVTPLTDDKATIEALLPALSVDIMPVSGDQAAAALRTAGELLRRVGSRHGEVLLISDGSADPAASLAAVHKLHARGVEVAVIGAGTAQGAPIPGEKGGFLHTATGGVQLARLDVSGLQALATAGGGHYQNIRHVQPRSLFATETSHDMAQSGATDRKTERWIEEGPWLLLPLLLLAAAGFRRGWLGVLVILLLPPPAAHAFEWQDLWLRPDQQASRLMQQGDAKAAARRFENPGWRAAAQYQAGDYTAAAQGFKGDNADTAYNRGNALARAGRLQQALASYDSALKLQSDNKDARFNRDLIEKLLRQQQSQQQSSPQNGQQGGNQNRQQQSGQGQQNSKTGNGSQAKAGGQSAGNAQNRPHSGAQNQAGGGAQRQSANNAQNKAGNGSQNQPNNGAKNQAGNQSQKQPNNAAQKQSGTNAQSGTQPHSGEHANGGKSEQAGQQTAERQPNEQQAGGKSGNDKQAAQAATAADSKQQSGKGRAAGNTAAQAGAEPRPGQTSASSGRQQLATPPPDSAAQARADVDAGARLAGQPQPGATESTQPQTEQDIAMEQWLRQVPDDPAGLLRRKFMVEHLLRQKGLTTP